MKRRLAPCQSMHGSPPLPEVGPLVGGAGSAGSGADPVGIHVGDKQLAAIYKVLLHLSLFAGVRPARQVASLLLAECLSIVPAEGCGVDQVGGVVGGAGVAEDLVGYRCEDAEYVQGVRALMRGAVDPGMSSRRTLRLKGNMQQPGAGRGMCAPPALTWQLHAHERQGGIAGLVVPAPGGGPAAAVLHAVGAIGRVFFKEVC